ncbi:hypothetical protein QBC46DRAFT_421361 [Diplogelasinospora grovesii]|uniref:Uncharacterized protein n=1 Tax=Diplogelasinospora grovesii TaxID=303347 RepID=A0AAN6N1I9_9PEZI|nr:hypothetical protein QBC46DRAFT_421361 [Diplogelasinospora grovesii]
MDDDTIEEAEKKPLTSPDGRTFWFPGEGGAPIGEKNKRENTTFRGRLGAILTSAHLYYCIIIFLLVGLYIRDLTAFSRWHSRLSTPPTPSEDLPPLCGASPEEARALGCVFDVYVNGWLPAACYDKAVAEMSESNDTDLFPAAGGRTTYPIYWDEEFTKRATLEDVEAAAFANGEDGFNVRFHIAYDYHRAHCLHLWRLTASAAERLVRGERAVGVYYKAASPEHAWHCSKIIIEGDGRDPNKKDRITPGVGRCVGLDDAWNEMYDWAGRRKQH